MKIWLSNSDSKDLEYMVSLVSIGSMYRAEVYKSYNNGASYVDYTCGDWGDKESATKSYKRYVRKFCKKEEVEYENNK